jgi:hypothetical protein
LNLKSLFFKSFSKVYSTSLLFSFGKFLKHRKFNLIFKHMNVFSFVSYNFFYYFN